MHNLSLDSMQELTTAEARTIGGGDSIALTVVIIVITVVVPLVQEYVID